jgi:hypothetical protein
MELRLQERFSHIGIITENDLVLGRIRLGMAPIRAVNYIKPLDFTTSRNPQVRESTLVLGPECRIWARRDSNPRPHGCEPLIYTSGERLRIGVEQAMMPITACLPLPPVTWGLRTRCEQRRERHLRIVPPGLLGFTVESVPHCECSKRFTAAWVRPGHPVMSSRRFP